MKGNPRCAAILALAACSVLAGCAPAARVAGLKAASTENAAPVPRASDAVPASCRFSVESMRDLREQAHLGSLGVTQVDGNDFVKWLGAGIAGMPEYSAGPAPVALNFEILRAYIQGLGTLKSAHLVVRVKVSGDKARPFEKLYRGVDNSINWNNSESEIQSAFERAVTHLKQQISSDLPGLCGKASPPA